MNRICIILHREGNARCEERTARYRVLILKQRRHWRPSFGRKDSSLSQIGARLRKAKLTRRAVENGFRRRWRSCWNLPRIRESAARRAFELRETRETLKKSVLARDGGISTRWGCAGIHRWW